jgi:chemotaxis protein methyltransferase CheR
MLEIVLSPKVFEAIAGIVYRETGIALKAGKEGLVRSRLMKRLRTLEIGSFAEYLRLLENDPTGRERMMMIDCITTNKTHFFREPSHFEYLKKHILPNLSERRLRIWSAACSSGEEPYSIAVVLRENIPDIDQWDVRILATDISTRVLEKARTGRYGAETLEGLSPALIANDFTCEGARSARIYEAKPEIKRMVTLARLNLLEAWPMKGPFDVIFCRNVMIYFDKETQRNLVERFRLMLEPGGYLFTGHSESMAGFAHQFRYVQPAVYAR